MKEETFIKPAYIAAIGLLLIGLNFAFDLWRDIRYANCIQEKEETSSILSYAVRCAAFHSDPQFPFQKR